MPDGILIIDKPTGWTSMDVCAKLRGILREKRIGHAGTLDPMATGVLPVFVGRATKAVQFAENGRKEYRAVLKLGTVTDTQDTTGAVLEAHPVTVGADEVRAALEHFTGELLQLPPMYSALKVNGQKLYDLARQGKTVERKPRAITVYELELLEQSAPDEFALRVVCSKGTYIRTLCHDLGQALGCGGCMAALRRTMAAGFRIEEAVTLERAQEEREALLLPLDEYFRAYPRFTVQNETQEKRAYNGNAFTARGVADGEYRVYDRAGNFLSLSRAEGGGLPGVETRGEVVYTRGVAAGRMTVAGMCRALCENPAKLYGLYPRKGVIAAGSDADIVVYDPKASHILSARDMVTKAGYTPFEGLRTEGGIAKVYLRGNLMVEDGRIVGGPEGQYLRRGLCTL